MKRVMCVLAFGVVLSTGAFAGTISWIYTGDLGSSYQAGWLVELVEDVNKDGIQLGGGAGSGSALYTDGTTDSDDTLVSAVTDSLVVNAKDGSVYWGSSFSAPSGDLALGDNVYTVIYNADTFENADQYIVVDASPYALPSADQDASYTPNTVAGSWAPIVPVPEPGTIALFALGLMTMVARRKRK